MEGTGREGGGAGMTTDLLVPPLVPPSALVPFDSTSGRKDARIILVGEAFGENEEKVGLPFVGYSGQELTQMLSQAGLRRGECLLTNVFPFRPPNNQIKALCGPKASVGKDYPLLPLATGQYVLNQYLPCLDRLRAEIEAVRPNLVVTLGGTATWALTGSSGITRLRGVITPSTLCPGIKVLPTFHPAAILRQWQLRPIVVADLMKAKLEAGFPEIRRQQRSLLLSPTLPELYEWWSWLKGDELLAADIETKDKQVTMISFADSHLRGVVVPFIKPKHLWKTQGVSYWASLREELLAWDFVKEVLASSNPKLWQNGAYDIQYLARMGFLINNCLHDTMLLHHAHYPELPKGLGFLGSIYCNESAWKDLRTAKEEEKKDA